MKASIGDFVTSVEGRVSDASDGGLTLALTSVRRRGEPTPSTWGGESIQLAPADIHEVKRRELSRTRTVFASTAIAAAGIGVIYTIARATGLVSGSSGQGKPPAP